MIVVTGATGQIGSKVLEALLQAQDAAAEVRVVVRDPEKLPAGVRERAEIVVGSHKDPDVVDRAFAGADTVFWLMASDPAAPSVYESYVTATIPAADAIVRHGVKRVVVISALGRGTQLYAGHVSASIAMEDLLRSTGAHVRTLACPGFMDNLLRQVPVIASSGTFSFPMPGNAPYPAASTGDIAAVAVRFLLDRSWTGQESVGVLGPEDLTFEQMAEILTDVLGTPIRYEVGDSEQFEKTLIGYGHTVPMARAFVAMTTAKSNGLDNFLQRTAENSTPTSFRSWAEEILKPAVEAAHI
jgi:uncharacterized protein YbjT (DUF2867 family)